VSLFGTVASTPTPHATPLGAVSHGVYMVPEGVTFTSRTRVLPDRVSFATFDQVPVTDQTPTGTTTSQQLVT
jgi:hypothetical protein